MTDIYTRLEDRFPIRKSIDKINHIVGAHPQGWMQDPEIELADSKYIKDLVSCLSYSGMDDDDQYYAVSFK